VAEGARAAALVPVTVGADGERRVVVIRRAEGGRHGGEIGLPGGIAEPIDFRGIGSLVADCLRVGNVRIGGATHRILAPLLERFVSDPQLHR
jgi:hypothetical protein